MIDWLAALGAQDQSLESSMARNSMLKEMEPLLRVQALKQQKDQEEAQRALQEREFNTRQEEIKTQRAETQRRYDEGVKRQQETERRNRANTVHDNLKAGDRMSVTDPDLQLMRETGAGGQFTADPNDPNYVIYLKHAYDVATADKAKKDAIEQANQKRADEHLRLAKEQAERERKAAEQNQKLRDQKIAAFDQKQKDLQAKMDKLPPVLAQQAQREQAQYDKAAPQGWTETDDAYIERTHQKHGEIIDRITREAEAKGLMKPKAPVPQGRGGGPGPGPVQSEYLSPEEVKQKFPNLPPGARVRRIG